jgi:hypothetical protein
MNGRRRTKVGDYSRMKERVREACFSHSPGTTHNINKEGINWERKAKTESRKEFSLAPGKKTENSSLDQMPRDDLRTLGRVHVFWLKLTDKKGRQ